MGRRLSEAWLNYYFYSPDLPYSPESLALKRHEFPGADDDRTQVQSSGEAGKMPIGNGIESRQVADEQRILSRTLGGARPGPAAESTLTVGDKVESRVKLESVSGTIPPLSKGTVLEVSGAQVKIDLGRFGVHDVNAQTAARSFVVLPGHSQQDSIRESFGIKPAGSFNVGARLKDDRGFQYTVTQRDTFGRTLQVLGEDGSEHVVVSNALSAVDPKAPFPIREGMQTEPFAPSERVRVVGVDPIFNQWRTRGVPNMEAGAYVGQVGFLEFAFYPAGGVRMYRVLFERGARRDFSDAELEPVATPQGAPV